MASKSSCWPYLKFICLDEISPLFWCCRVLVYVYNNSKFLTLGWHWSVLSAVTLPLGCSGRRFLYIYTVYVYFIFIFVFIYVRILLILQRCLFCESSIFRFLLFVSIISFVYDNPFGMPLLLFLLLVPGYFYLLRSLGHILTSIASNWPNQCTLSVALQPSSDLELSSTFSQNSISYRPASLILTVYPLPVSLREAVIIFTGTNSMYKLYNVYVVLVNSY